MSMTRTSNRWVASRRSLLEHTSHSASRSSATLGFATRMKIVVQARGVGDARSWQGQSRPTCTLLRGRSFVVIAMSRDLRHLSTRTNQVSRHALSRKTSSRGKLVFHRQKNVHRPTSLSSSSLHLTLCSAPRHFGPIRKISQGWKSRSSRPAASTRECLSVGESVVEAIVAKTLSQKGSSRRLSTSRLSCEGAKNRRVFKLLQH